MKKARKALLTLCAALLLVSVTAGVTIAYLTDTESVINTFKVGQVDTTLDETQTDLMGVANGEGRKPEGNEYQLYPGTTYIKDPIIHVTGSTKDVTYEDSYVVAKVVVTADKIADLRALLSYNDTDMIGFKDIVTGGVFDYTDYTVSGNKWTSANANIDLLQVANESDNTFYVFFKSVQKPNAYDEETGENGAAIDLELFEKIVIPEEWNNTEIAKMAGLKMDITAYAMQATGFENVYDAFKGAFETEYTAAGNPANE